MRGEELVHGHLPLDLHDTGFGESCREDLRADATLVLQPPRDDVLPAAVLGG